MAKTNDKRYFTDKTEQAIILYNLSQDPVERAKLFQEEIYHPFYKLAENIIHTFKFYYMDVDNVEDLKHEIVTMLLEEKIDKFDSTNGAKAFSYFGTIVKRWLINYNNKNYKNLRKQGTFEEYDSAHILSEEMEEVKAISLSTLIDEYVEEMYGHLEEMFEKEVEQKIADAVLSLFSDRHDLEIFKKKALYIYIREITECETPHLTRVINILKDKFYEMYWERYEEGLLII